MISLKQIAFNIYDMNSDNRLCEYDLFASIKSTNNKLFIDTINQDFIDIRAKMQQKEIDSGTFEVTKSMNNDTMQITDLKRWLSERESKYAIQETFYKVFQDKSTLPVKAGKEDKVERGDPLSLERNVTEVNAPAVRSKRDASVYQKAAQAISPQIKEMQQCGQHKGLDAEGGRKNIDMLNLFNKSD